MGQFTRHIPNDPSTVTIDFVLTATELAVVYQRMMVINFFSYPASPPPIATPETGLGHQPSYHFTVRRNGQFTQVNWAPMVLPHTSLERQLGELADLITTQLRARPEIGQLRRGYGCT